MFRSDPLSDPLSDPVSQDYDEVMARIAAEEAAFAGLAKHQNDALLEIEDEPQHGATSADGSVFYAYNLGKWLPKARWDNLERVRLT
jgi:hypothetical protein